MNEMTVVCHSLKSNTLTGSSFISLFECKSFDQSDPPEWTQILDIYSVVRLYNAETARWLTFFSHPFPTFEKL